jgi:hypothetical protein
MQATTVSNSSRNAKSFYYTTKPNLLTIGMHQQVGFTTFFSPAANFGNGTTRLPSGALAIPALPPPRKSPSI